MTLTRRPNAVNRKNFKFLSICNESGVLFVVDSIIFKRIQSPL